MVCGIRVCHSHGEGVWFSAIVDIKCESNAHIDGRHPVFPTGRLHSNEMVNSIYFTCEWFKVMTALFSIQSGNIHVDVLKFDFHQRGSYMQRW